MTAERLPLTYVLPIRVARPEGPELAGYLGALCGWVQEVVVVDGSDAEVFDVHRRDWPADVVHIRPDDERFGHHAGKAKGVHTGLARASHDVVVVADDDVRWTAPQLRRVADLFQTDGVDFVRPQNVFDPRPWHASWDTGRTLINRVLGGDHGGTVALRKGRFDTAGGYDGAALFENLELERTIQAVGGRVRAALDVVVVRRPPPTSHFLRQRVRQAYDEFARPGRLLVQLALLPTVVAAVVTGRRKVVAALALGVVGLAEAGRRRDGGQHAYPATAAWWAPLWVAERAVTSWLAVGSRVVFGGVRWGDRRMRLAANKPSTLAERVRGLAASASGSTNG